MVVTDCWSYSYVYIFLSFSSISLSFLICLCVMVICLLITQTYTIRGNCLFIFSVFLSWESCDEWNWYWLFFALYCPLPSHPSFCGFGGRVDVTMQVSHHHILFRFGLTPVINWDSSKQKQTSKTISRPSIWNVYESTLWYVKWEAMEEERSISIRLNWIFHFSFQLESYEEKIQCEMKSHQAEQKSFIFNCCITLLLLICPCLVTTEKQLFAMEIFNRKAKDRIWLTLLAHLILYICHANDTCQLAGIWQTIEFLNLDCHYPTTSDIGSSSHPCSHGM